MSRRTGDDWIEAFVRYTQNTEPRESFKRWTAISTVAAVLQRKCFLRWGSETFYPNMYIVLVGPPASRKGSAMRPGRDLLNKIGIYTSANASSWQKLVGSLKEQIETGQGPDGKMVMHASMNIISTELTVFLGYESRELLSALCDWYDCTERFKYDTYARGKEEVPNVWVNLFGATTPSQLQAALPEGAVGSGFTSRVVFVYEEDKARMIIEPTLDEEMEDALQTDLGEIHGIYGPFHMEAEARDMYAEWRREGESKQLFSDPRLDYYIQRRPTHLFKLSIIFSAARTSERVITPVDMQKAILTLLDAEKKMSSVFAGVGQNPLAGLQLRISRVLAQRKQMPIRELASMFSNDAGYTQFGEAISSLAQMGHVQHDAVARTIRYTKEE